MLHTPSLPFILLAFACLLGPLVTLHELGHYWVARWLGIKAEVFSVGFGRELVGWTDRRGTRWKLAALPLGGYVRFSGDADMVSSPGECTDISGDGRKNWLNHRPLWQRALVVLAGPAANFLVAVVIFASFNLTYGVLKAPPVVAGFVAPSPARDAGVALGDRITSVDGTTVDNFEDIREIVFSQPGETVHLTLLHDGRRISLPVVLGVRVVRDPYGNESRVGVLGIAAGNVRSVRVGPIRSVSLGLKQSISVFESIITGVHQIVSGKRNASELGGPVKIARYSGEQMALGWQNFVYFSALISINLAFINLLPIPALDGGHLLFFAVEAMRRKPFDRHMQELVFRTGFALMLALMLWVTVHDVASLHILG